MKWTRVLIFVLVLGLFSVVALACTEDGPAAPSASAGVVTVQPTPPASAVSAVDPAAGCNCALAGCASVPVGMGEAVPAGSILLLEPLANTRIGVAYTQPGIAPLDGSYWEYDNNAGYPAGEACLVSQAEFIQGLTALVRTDGTVLWPDRLAKCRVTTSATLICGTPTPMATAKPSVTPQPSPTPTLTPSPTPWPATPEVVQPDVGCHCRFVEVVDGEARCGSKLVAAGEAIIAASIFRHAQDTRLGVYFEEAGTAPAAGQYWAYMTTAGNNASRECVFAQFPYTGLFQVTDPSGNVIWTAPEPIDP